MLVNKTITVFIDELASDSPAPGGGSAAALVGALGAALCAMVMSLTKGEKFQDIAHEVEHFHAQAALLKDQLIKYVDDDTAAFNKVMAAYRFPKGTPEEKEKRTAAIQEAMQEAANLPFSVASACLEILELAAKVIKIGNPNAASDAAVGGVTAYAALQGALYNVKINLLSIKDEHYVNSMKDKVAALNRQAQERYHDIQSLARQAME